MKNAILLHGKPGKDEYFNARIASASNDHWYPWLQKQLVMEAIDTQTPEMLNAFEPDYAIWSSTFSRYECTPETMLVGHSCGGGFFVRYLSEHPEIQVDTLVLVAPWIDPDHELSTPFFDFTIDQNLPERVKRFLIFNSDDDHSSIHTTVKTLREAFPTVTCREFHGKGHFTVDSMPDNTFVELLDALLA